MAEFEEQRNMDHAGLRRMARAGLSSSKARSFFWPLFVKVGDGGGLGEMSTDIREQAKRRYTSIRQSVAGNRSPVEVNLELNEDPQVVTAHIVPLLMQQFDVKEPALLVPLVRILSTVLCNSAICFSTCSDILERPGWFSVHDTSSATYRANLALFRELVQRSTPKLSLVLTQLGALEDRFLSVIFVDLFNSILTTDQRYRFVSLPPLPSPP
jgi:hypothetical protein